MANNIFNRDRCLGLQWQVCNSHSHYIRTAPKKEEQDCKPAADYEPGNDYRGCEDF